MFLELNNIKKEFLKQNGVMDINLKINQGELVTLLGPSGCGKTTTLNIIGGFLKPDKGTIILEGLDITLLPPEKRPIATVFQSYALFPHMNVIENISYGLKYTTNFRRKERFKAAKEYIKIVGLKGYEYEHVGNLSGGQQQRVALARALITKPKLLLLDEPFSNLDAKLRIKMREEIKQIQSMFNITMIFVTHDQEEALTMSDTIVVLDEGAIQQIGTPEEIYNKPKNCFVSRFIGESNIVDGKITGDGLLEFAGAEFEYLEDGFEVGEEVDVVVRPEDVKLVESGKGNLEGVVELATFKGVYYQMIVKEGDRTWKIENINTKEKGQHVGININPKDIHIMKKSVKNKELAI